MQLRDSFRLSATCLRIAIPQATINGQCEFAETKNELNITSEPTDENSFAVGTTDSKRNETSTASLSVVEK